MIIRSSPAGFRRQSDTDTDNPSIGFEQKLRHAAWGEPNVKEAARSLALADIHGALHKREPVVDVGCVLDKPSEQLRNVLGA